MPPTKQKIPLSAIIAGPETQSRAAIDMERVEEYAEAMKIGDAFPDITVYWNGEDYWLADGFHRVYAARAAGVLEITAMVHEGMTRDALRWALSANSKHGMPRTIADKLRCLELAMRDQEWQRYPATELAKLCKVSLSFVQTHHPHLAKEIAGLPEPKKKKKRKARKPKNDKAPSQEAEVEDSPEVAPEPEQVLDETDRPVPDWLVRVFATRPEFKAVAGQIDAAIANVKLLADGEGGHYLKMHLQSIEQALRNAKMNLLHAAPYAVVNRPAGSQHPNWVSVDAWKALPERERA